MSPAGEPNETRPSRPGDVGQDARRVDPALRRKYDVRAPRYTSYPAATHFHPVEHEALRARFEERNGLGHDPGLSLYYHIPFCRSRCSFCGCHTFGSRGGDVVNAYADALIAEMGLAQRIVDPCRPVRQVALGGGTPNFLSVEQIERVLGQMHRRFAIHASAEVSVEIDPRTSTPEKLDAFLRQGANRFSLGIQDFSKTVLDIVRRGQGLMQVEDAVEFLRGKGAEAINFDLVYGLPGQDTASAIRTARQAIALDPKRIALYSYAHVPWIHAHQTALERAGLPDPDLKASIFFTMMDQFLAAGYIRIGMDHFAKPDDPLAVAQAARTLRRTFMGYTTGRGLDVLAFGASSISAVGASYSQDEKSLDAYLAGIREGRLPVARGFLLSRDDEIRKELLLELSCNFHVDLRSLSEQFGIDAAGFFAPELARLEPLKQDGLVRTSRDAVEATDIGRFFIRNICMVFDRYLEKDAGKRAYSRTV